ncbi:DoxX family protein [Streptomyces sp. NPDC055025]
MNISLWIVASLLAALLLSAGLGKLLQSKEKIVQSSGAWAASFSPGILRALGLLEVLGAIGLTLPAAVGVAPVLVPVAACGVAVLMADAAMIHARRAEWGNVALNAVLLVVAAVVAWGRFGPHAF